MALPINLVNQFAKLVNSNNKNSNETTLNGTYRVIQNSKYVQIDGSTELTPVTSAINVNNGDRVLVLIKNHSAIVTGKFN